MTIFNYLFRGMNALVTAQVCQLCGKVISGETDMEAHIEQDEIARRIVRYERRLRANRANKRSPKAKLIPKDAKLKILEKKANKLKRNMLLAITTVLVLWAIVITLVK